MNSPPKKFPAVSQSDLDKLTDFHLLGLLLFLTDIFTELPLES